MDVSNYIKATIGILIVSVVVVAAIFPIFTAAVDHTTTYSNEAAGDSYVLADGSETVTLAYDGTTYTVNGETVTPLGSNYAAVTSDEFSIRWSGSPSMFFMGDSWSLVVPSAFNLTAAGGTISGTYTVDSVDTEVSIEYEKLYYQDTDGEYIMASGSQAVYLNGDTEVLCTGYNSALGGSAASRTFRVTGSIDDGFTMVYGLGAGTLTSTAVNVEAVEGVENVYSLTSIEFTAGDTTITINRFPVPAEVTGVNSDAGDYALQDTIINIIPVLILVGVLLMTVGVFISNRRA